MGDRFGYDIRLDNTPPMDVRMRIGLMLPRNMHWARVIRLVIYIVIALILLNAIENVYYLMRFVTASSDLFLTTSFFMLLILSIGTVTGLHIVLLLTRKLSDAVYERLNLALLVAYCAALWMASEMFCAYMLTLTR